MYDFYVGDIGIKFIAALTQAGLAYNLNGATAAFLFIKPSGSTLNKSATPESPASGGLASWTWIAGDLDEAGTWQCIITTVKSGVTLHSRCTFTVGPIT